MRTTTLLSLALLLPVIAHGQILSAEVKANGLVCSVCSRSIEMSLRKLQFVDQVDVDLERTTTVLTFKDAQTVDINKIAKAVTKAGFSVGFIWITYKSAKPFSVDNNNCFTEGPYTFKVLDPFKEPPQENIRLHVIGPAFMSVEDFKQWSAALVDACDSENMFYYVSFH